MHIQAATALAVFEGAGIVLVAANEAWERLAGMKAPIGQPVAEVFVGPYWQPVVCALERAYATREAVRVERPYGVLTVRPLRFPDGSLGIASRFDPTAPVLPHVPRDSNPLPAAVDRGSPPGR